jgi:alkylation response protein AidB-like acyl-CoA dehydrogenase
MNGRKIWSTGAHISDYMIVLARTSPAEGRNRQVGLSQFLVPLKTPGIEVTGIRDLTGSVHFNETLFDNVRLSADTLLGTEGNGWAQCMGELATERSGPERFLTTFVILEQTLAQLRDKLDEQGLIIAGRLLAHLTSLRCMSRGIARLIQSGDSPDTEAALVKQMGNALERNILDDMRRLLATVPQPPTELATLITDATLRLPSHTLRGGTTEILRGIIARQLGLR